MATIFSRRALTALTLCLTLGALARVGSYAQFSFPYDPDFAPQKPEPLPDLKPKPVEPSEKPEKKEDLKISPEIPDFVREAGPFLLLDRQDPKRIFETYPSTPEPLDFSEFLKKLEEDGTFRIDQSKWNKMREDLERGILPREEIETLSPPPEAIALSTAVPPTPPRPELELPTYGTSLSITGRKLVGFQFTEKRFLNEQRTTARSRNTNLIDITQQLQLRMQGKVGPKITVNVDYDDTKTNKQDISVVYAGDPNEVVQNASFGDIDLSLPSTEFVSYNKQLFGIRVNLKWKGFKAIVIGSRTKGTTKTKQFKGNTQFTTLDLQDTGYVRRRFYDLSFGVAARLPIRTGSEKVFLSRQSAGQQNIDEITLTVDDLAVNTSSFTGRFLQLSPGQDYTVDYVKGILTFRNTLEPSAVVAVDFVDATGIPISVQTSTQTGTSGGTGRNKLIKTFADLPIRVSTEAGHARELKTFYSIGRSQILRDDGRGNFFLRVLDRNRSEVGPTLNPPQQYPETIDVDFENGTFQLQKPFGKSAQDPSPDPEIYSPSPISKRLIQLEFRFRLKTFFLEPSLVLQSEVVLLDGVRLNRNVDYFVDYESGFLTFFNEQRIRPESVIDVSYEVAPFSGVQTESLLGGRVSYDFNKHWAVGSTLLFQTASKPPTVPAITELAKSLFVYEADTQLKDIKIFRWLSGSFQGEIAQSLSNPNLSRKALIENMEGIKQEEIASTLDTNWQIASNPTQTPSDPRVLALTTEDVPVRQINPNAPVGQSESQKVLNVSYNFTLDTSTETSIVYAFSPTGLDFTQKNILEVTMFQGSVTNNQINFHLGGINEDADADAALDTEDANRDSILQPGEDIGFLYNPSGKTSKRFGANNGRIDSEDLNQNGRLDPADFSGDDFGYLGNAGTSANKLFDATSGSTRTILDFTGWHTFQIPLNITTATFNNWLAIKQIRISIRRPSGGTSSGTLKFARVAVVGNSWQRGQAGDPSTGQGARGSEKLTLNAVNNVDNPAYVPIFRAGGQAQEVFNDLYGSPEELQKQSGSTSLSEQALELRFENLTTGTTVFTRRNFVRAIDISQHKNFHFLLFGNADDSNINISGQKIFFLRAGADRSFFEIRVPLNFQGWRKFTVTQQDTNGDQIADTWTLGQGTAQTVVLSSGSPSLQQVGSLITGLYSTGSTAPNLGAVYLNEIHVSDPITRKGTALKLQVDFTIPGWAGFGVKHRLVDRNYQTPTTVVANQDNRQDSMYLNLDRIRSFPMRFNVARTITVTPNTNVTGSNSNLVSLLQQGKVTTWAGSASGNLNLSRWPQLTLNHNRNRTEYDLLTRLDDRNTYGGTLSYAVPLQRRYIPKNIDFNASYSKYSVSFESLKARTTPGNFNTDEFTQTYGLRLSFVPWQGSNFNPNYSLTTVKEKRSDLTSGREKLFDYPKSLNQSAGFASNFRLLSWLNPSINYNITTIENNILNKSTFVVTRSTFVFDIGDIKTINRSANGSINLTLNMSEILKNSKLLRSLTFINSYQLQDGDVYNNVEKGLDTRSALWIRTPLSPRNVVAKRVNLTLRDTYNSTQRWSPLEAYALMGRKAAFRTFALTNNFVQSVQRNEVTGTPSKTISTTLPDLVASMAQLERLLFVERWAANGQINMKFAMRETENVNASLDSDSSFGTDLRAILLKRFDTTLSFNLRNSQKEDLRLKRITQKTHHKDATLQTTFDIKKFRFTPKVDYQNDTTTLGTGAQTQNTTVLTPSLLIRGDLAMPRGLYIPFFKKPFEFTNRVIWTTTLSLAVRSSPVSLVDNSRLFNLNTSADYEIAKNLRMTLNGAISRLWHKFKKEDEFISYQFGTLLTLQF